MNMNEMRALANEAKAAKTQERRDRLQALFTADPTRTASQFAKQLGCHPNTVYKDLKALGIQRTPGPRTLP